MSDNVIILFASLADGLTAEEAKNRLQKKLKLSSAIASKFLSGAKAFNPTTKEKALKQQKVFASLGIDIKVISAKAKSSPQISQAEKDEKILNALDYITTSLIQLEEKVDALSQNAQSQLPSLNEEDEFTQHQETIAFEEDLDEPIKLGSNKLLFIFIAVFVVLLVILLAVSLAYPEIFDLNF